MEGAIGETIFTCDILHNLVGCILFDTPVFLWTRIARCTTVKQSLFDLDHIRRLGPLSCSASRAHDVLKRVPGRAAGGHVATTFSLRHWKSGSYQSYQAVRHWRLCSMPFSVGGNPRVNLQVTLICAPQADRRLVDERDRRRRAHTICGRCPAPSGEKSWGHPGPFHVVRLDKHEAYSNGGTAVTGIDS